MTKCCFCGKDVGYRVNSNDPRPIVTTKEDCPYCCDDCNDKIVIPTRLHVWLLDDRINELERALIDENRERKITEKALSLARKYMFNVMCADDVPSEEWFIKCAKEDLRSE